MSDVSRAMAEGSFGSLSPWLGASEGLKMAEVTLENYFSALERLWGWTPEPCKDQLVEITGITLVVLVLFWVGEMGSWISCLEPRLWFGNRSTTPNTLESLRVFEGLGVVASHAKIRESMGIKRTMVHLEQCAI